MELLLVLLYDSEFKPVFARSLLQNHRILLELQRRSPDDESVEERLRLGIAALDFRIGVQIFSCVVRDLSHAKNAGVGGGGGGVVMICKKEM